MDEHPDVGTLVGADAVQQAVAKAVSRELDAEVRAIATAAVAQALTPEVRETLRQDAARRAVEAVAGDADTPPDTPTDSGEPPPAQLAFRSLPEFVESYVLPNWRHSRGEDVRWCEVWWEHSEAVLHLEALWESFEQLRLDPAGTSTSIFLLNYFVPHLTHLTSPEGPFTLCSTHESGIRDRHRVMDSWKSAPAPEGLFAVEEPPS